MENKRIVTLRPNMWRYTNCSFCRNKEDIKELLFTREDGNGNIFHVCESCLEKLKKEILEIENN